MLEHGSRDAQVNRALLPDRLRHLIAPNLVHILAWFLLIAWASLVTALYLKNENAFYWSDYNFYAYATGALAELIIMHTFMVPLFLWQSLQWNHGLIVAIPSALFEIMFGVSRLSYISSMVVLYLLPFAASLGVIATKVIAAPRWQVFWSTVLITLSLPPMWVPSLRGYPDCLAALVVSLSLLCYLTNRDMRNTNKVVGLGLLLALAPLLRRHFIYADIALVLAIIIDQFVLARQINGHSGEALKSFAKAMLGRFSITVAFTLFCFGTVGLRFTQQLLLHNYKTLYQSFDVSLIETVNYFFHVFGTIIWLFVLAGFVLARQSKLYKPDARFIHTFATLAAGIWLFLVNILGAHYNLYFSWLVVLGLVSFFWYIAGNAPALIRNTALSLMLVFFLTNLSIGLAPPAVLDRLGIKVFRPDMLNLVEQEGDLVGWLFSANYPPLARTDREEVVRLADYLRSLAPKRELIYVASCSKLLNTDVIKNAERSKYGQKGQALFLPEIPNVDSRDSYPLEMLLQTDYLVLAEPLQFAIKPKEQDLLALIAKCFREKWKLAADFEELPEHFTLDDGVTVSVFKRLRPTSLPIALETLTIFKKELPRRPGGQPMWIGSTEISMQTGEERKRDYSITLLPPRELKGTKAVRFTHDAFLLSSNTAPVTSTLELTVTRGCLPGRTLVFDLVDETGAKVTSSQKVNLQDCPLPVRFDCNPSKPAYALISIARDKQPVADSYDLRTNVKLDKIRFESNEAN